MISKYQVYRVDVTSFPRWRSPRWIVWGKRVRVWMWARVAQSHIDRKKLSSPGWSPLWHVSVWRGWRKRKERGKNKKEKRRPHIIGLIGPNDQVSLITKERSAPCNGAPPTRAKVQKKAKGSGERLVTLRHHRDFFVIRFTRYFGFQRQCSAINLRHQRTGHKTGWVGRSTRGSRADRV